MRTSQGCLVDYYVEGYKVAIVFYCFSNKDKYVEVPNAAKNHQYIIVFSWL